MGSKPTQRIIEKCEQYWNESGIGDVEIHAALGVIHGHATVAADLIDTQATEIKSFHAAIARSPYDIGPCMECGEPVVCLPDGMPMCDPCGVAAQETKTDG